MLHSTSFDTDYNGLLICLQRKKSVTQYKTHSGCTEFSIWPKSTVEKSSKEGIAVAGLEEQDKNPNLRNTFLYISSTNTHEGSISKSKALGRKTGRCPSGEGNKCTYSLVKKRWHIYCYINVIYILCFLLQRQKRNVLLAAGFFYS